MKYSNNPNSANQIASIALEQHQKEFDWLIQP